MRQPLYMVEIDREADGRWIAEVGALPGVMVYGNSEAEAYQAAVALALRVLADQVEHGEGGPSAAVLEMFAHA